MKQQPKSSNSGVETQGQPSRGVVCYPCISEGIYVKIVGSYTNKIEGLSLLMLHLLMMPQNNQLYFQQMNMPSSPSIMSFEVYFYSHHCTCLVK